MTRPNDWHQMSYDQQRAWEKQERTMNEVEYELRRESEDRARAEIDARRVRADYKMEMESAQGQRDELQSKINQLRRSIRWFNQFLKMKGLTEEYDAWQPEPEEDDDDEF